MNKEISYLSCISTVYLFSVIQLNWFKQFVEVYQKKVYKLLDLQNFVTQKLLSPLCE